MQRTFLRLFFLCDRSSGCRGAPSRALSRDLIDRSARVELAHLRTAHEKELSRFEGHRRMAIAMAAMCAVLVEGVDGTAAWALGIRSESARQRTDSEQRISAQLRDAQLASDQAFKRFQFSGLVHDSRDRRVRCSEVEAYVQDLAGGGERKVPKSCDGSGSFAFSAPELKNDRAYSDPLTSPHRPGEAGT